MGHLIPLSGEWLTEHGLRIPFLPHKRPAKIEPVTVSYEHPTKGTVTEVAPAEDIAAHYSLKEMADAAKAELPMELPTELPTTLPTTLPGAEPADTTPVNPAPVEEPPA